MSVVQISSHTRFVQARKPRYRHEAGKIIHTAKWGDEALTREEVFLRVQQLDLAAQDVGYAAVRAAEDARLLRAAWDQYLAFWEVAQDYPGDVA